MLGQTGPKVHLKFPRLRVDIRIPVIGTFGIQQLLRVTGPRGCFKSGERVEQALNGPRRLREERKIWFTRLDPRSNGDLGNENAEGLDHLGTGELAVVGSCRVEKGKGDDSGCW